MPQSIGTILIDVQANTQKLVKGMNSAERLVGKSVNNLKNTIIGLTSAYIALEGVGLAKTFIRQADAMTNVNSKLKLVTNSTGELLDVQNKLFNISQKTRSSFTDNVDLYQKISFSTKELNLTQKEQLLLTEQINKELLISGTTASGAATLITQLGQAFSSNFQAVSQEINTLKDQAPSLYQTILAGTGKTTAEFKKMAEQGELSSDIIINAITKQASITDESFSKIATTTNKAYGNIENTTNKLIGKFDEVSGLSQSLSNNILDISKSLDSINDEDIDSFIDLSKNVALAATSMVAVNVAMKTGKAIATSHATAMALLGGSYNSLNAKILLATASQKAFNLAFKASIFGLASTGIFLIADALLQASENSATLEKTLNSSSEALKKLTKNQLEYRKSLLQTELQEQRLTLANAKADAAKQSFFESDEEFKRDLAYRDEQIAKFEEIRKKLVEVKKIQKEIDEPLVREIGGVSVSAKAPVKKIDDKDIITTSLSDWQDYYKKIGDYETAWLFEEEENKKKWIDLTEEQFKVANDIAKKEFFDNLEDKEISISFVPVFEQQKLVAEEWGNALDKYPNDMEEVNNHYLKEFESIGKENNQAMSNSLSDGIVRGIVDGDMKGILSAFTSKFENVLADNISDMISGLTSSTGTTSTSSSLSGGGGLIGTIISAVGILGTKISGDYKSDLANLSTQNRAVETINEQNLRTTFDNFLDKFEKFMDNTVGRLEKVGSTGSSFVAEYKGLQKQIDKSNENQRKALEASKALSNQAYYTSIIAASKSSKKSITSSFKNPFSSASAMIGSGFGGGLPEFAMATQASRDTAVLMSQTYVQQAKQQQEQAKKYLEQSKEYNARLNTLLNDTLVGFLDYSRFNRAELTELTEGFNKSNYNTLLKELSEIALQVKIAGGSATSSQLNRMKEIYSIPNFLLGQDYESAITALDSLNDSIFDIIKNANKFELDFSLLEDTTNLRKMQIEEEKAFLIQQLPELSKLTKDNFVDIYESIDSTNTDLIESYEEYGNLLIEQNDYVKNLNISFTSLSKTFLNLSDSVEDTINKLLGGSDDVDANSILIDEYLKKEKELNDLLTIDSRTLTEIQKSKISDLVGDVNQLATNIQESTFGDNGKITNELIGSLTQIEKGLDLGSEILNVKIVGFDSELMTMNTDLIAIAPPSANASIPTLSIPQSNINTNNDKITLLLEDIKKALGTNPSDTLDILEGIATGQYTIQVNQIW